MIEEENKKVQESMGDDATVLADAGYQGLTKLVPGAVTPKKKNHVVESLMKTI